MVKASQSSTPTRYSRAQFPQAFPRRGRAASNGQACHRRHLALGTFFSPPGKIPLPSTAKAYQRPPYAVLAFIGFAYGFRRLGVFAVF